MVAESLDSSCGRTGSGRAIFVIGRMACRRIGRPSGNRSSRSIEAAAGRAHVNLPARRRRHGGWRLGTGYLRQVATASPSTGVSRCRRSSTAPRPSTETGKGRELCHGRGLLGPDIRLAADRSCPDRVRASRVGTRSARQGRMCCAPRRRSCEGVGQAVGMATGVRNSADNQARWKHFRRPISSTDRLIGAVPPPGLEPGTCGLKVRSSTN